MPRGSKRDAARDILDEATALLRHYLDSLQLGRARSRMELFATGVERDSAGLARKPVQADKVNVTVLPRHDPFVNGFPASNQRRHAEHEKSRSSPTLRHHYTRQMDRTEEPIGHWPTPPTVARNASAMADTTEMLNPSPAMALPRHHPPAQPDEPTSPSRVPKRPTARARGAATCAALSSSMMW